MRVPRHPYIIHAFGQLVFHPGDVGRRDDVSASLQVDAEGGAGFFRKNILRAGSVGRKLQEELVVPGNIRMLRGQAKGQEPQQRSLLGRVCKEIFFQAGDHGRPDGRHAQRPGQMVQLGDKRVDGQVFREGFDEVAKRHIRRQTAVAGRTAGFFEEIQKSLFVFRRDDGFLKREAEDGRDGLLGNFPVMVPERQETGRRREHAAQSPLGRVAGRPRHNDRIAVCHLPLLRFNETIASFPYEGCALVRAAE